MPFVDKEKNREYQRQWAAKRRATVLQGLVCYSCKVSNAVHVVGRKDKGTRKFSFTGSLETTKEKIKDCLLYCDNCFEEARSLRLQAFSTLHGHARSKVKSTKRTPTYTTWLAMRSRCYDINHRRYENYGQRGITVCDRWRHSFENFLADMGERPEGHTIDRIDPYGNYEPSNCRWADAKTQANNRRVKPDPSL